MLRAFAATTARPLAKAAHARGALSTATMSAAWAAKPPPPPAILAPPPKEKEEDKAKEGDAKKEGEKKEEPKPVEPKLEPEYAEPKLEAEVLENPARVLRAQERVIAPLPGSRYVPISDKWKELLHSDKRKPKESTDKDGVSDDATRSQ